MVSEDGIEKAIANIETLKKELNELRADQAEGLKQLKAELLDLRRTAVRLKIDVDVKVIRDILHEQFSNNPNFITQLFADASASKSKVNESQIPDKIEASFHTKWVKRLETLGANASLDAPMDFYLR